MTKGGLILGVSGTRDGMTHEQRTAIIDWLSVKEFHHGDCIGVDDEMHELVETRFPLAKIVIHPPDKDVLRAFRHGDSSREPLPYLQRNREIVKAVEYMMIVPGTMTETTRSGTWYTYRYAVEVGKPGRVWLPDGDGWDF